MKKDNMVKKIVGALLALAVVVVVGVVAFNSLNSKPESSTASSDNLTVLKGIVGSEKKDFFEDEEVQKVFANQGFKIEIETAGSREIAEKDLTGYDFAFPSSAPAANKIASTAKVSETFSPFYSPMAIATWKPIINILSQNGAATENADGSWNIDMNGYLALVESNKRWNELTGATEYNSPQNVLLSSTDIRKSNSAAMYLSIISYVLNSNRIVSDTNQAESLIPKLAPLFVGQGYTGSSSEEPFRDYLSQGIGKSPMVMIYEAQFVGEALKEKSRITEDMVIAYPAPTVFSTHTVVPFNENAKKIGQLLTDNEELINLEAKHGFRPTNDNTIFVNKVTESGIQVQTNITNVVETPTYELLETMLDKLSEQF